MASLSCSALSFIWPERTRISRTEVECFSGKEWAPFHLRNTFLPSAATKELLQLMMHRGNPLATPSINTLEPPLSGLAFRTTAATHGGAIPMACRLASPTMLALPISPGFKASWAWIRACSSAAFLAFSMASFMKVAAWEGWIVLPMGSRSDWDEEEIFGCWQRNDFCYTAVLIPPAQVNTS